MEERWVQRLGASGMLRLTVGGGLCQPSSVDTHRSHESQSITARTRSQEFKADGTKVEKSEIRRKNLVIHLWGQYNRKQIYTV